MLARSTRAAILRLSSEGHGCRAIASLLSVARNSVRSVVKRATEEPPKLNRRSAVDPHGRAIVQLLLDLDGNISKVYRALSDTGVEIK